MKIILSVILLLSICGAGNAQVPDGQPPALEGAAALCDETHLDRGAAPVDDEISVGDVVLKRRTLGAGEIELWMPDTFVEMSAEQVKKSYPPEAGITKIFSPPGEKRPALAFGLGNIQMLRGFAGGMIVRFDIGADQVTKWLPVGKKIFESVKLKMEPPKKAADEVQLALIGKRLSEKLKKMSSAKILIQEVRKVEDRNWCFIDSWTVGASVKEGRIRSMVMGYYIPYPNDPLVLIMQAKAKNQIHELKLQLGLHYLDEGAWPGQLSDLADLTDKDLVDPWGHPFHYSPPEKTDDIDGVKVYTLGKDGVVGGSGADQDWGYCRDLGAVKWPCPQKE